MAKFNNSNKNNFIDSLPSECLDTSDLITRSKFCFSYFDKNQNVGQSFNEWNEAGGALSSLNIIQKLIEYTREPLSYWEKKGQQHLVIYGEFPLKSDFIHPKHIPHDVRWGRFRLGNKIRLVGFVVPDELDGEIIEKNGCSFRFDRNTFYVVFLDKHHKFYCVEKP